MLESCFICCLGFRDDIFENIFRGLFGGPSGGQRKEQKENTVYPLKSVSFVHCVCAVLNLMLKLQTSHLYSSSFKLFSHDHK